MEARACASVQRPQDPMPTMPLLRYTLGLLLAATLAGASAQSLPAAATTTATTDPAYVGLPQGGGLDGGLVAGIRYGTAAGSDTATVARAAPAARIPGALATLTLEALDGDGEGVGDGKDQRLPLTFGQVFAPAALKRGELLQAVLADGSTVPLQADIKARHPDGSIRHAVLSALVPASQPGKPFALGLVKAKRPDLAKTGKGHDGSLDALVRGGTDARVELTLEGKTYTAALGRLLATAAPTLWLDGPVAREWQVAAPLAGPGGQPHPHLAARFAVRWYPALAKARIDLTLENNWAFAPAPQNFTYDVRVSVGGKQVYAKKDLTHYHHARWRKLFWTGDAPTVHLRHDTGQLIASLALPNYDQSLKVNEGTLSRMHARWNGARVEPMGIGLALAAMPTTGGRPDIGLQPAWAAMYLLGMDRRAGEMTIGTATLAGSWSMHYRDERTGLPVSLLDFPYMTIVGNPGDTRNPATGKRELFPACAAADACKTPYRHDISHQPAFSYLPYLLTGDHYHLEELQFWAMYDVFASNPGYRDNRKGLLRPEQVRGQAWALRTLGQAAYITPDAHPLKRDFVQILDANLDWYNATYTHNPQANALGIVVNGYAMAYTGGRGMAPWQDDFFTAAIGHLAELGFAKARELMMWKATYPVARMTGKGMCWISGAMYSMNVRDSATAPFYPSIGEAYRASIAPELRGLSCAGSEMAAALKLRTGEMTGYSSGDSGFPSNMQPALAYAADVLGEDGARAWRQFMARSVKPDYGTGPQFAIVPR